LAISYCELRGGRLPLEVKNPKSSEHQRSAPDLSMLPAEERSVVARALDPTWLDRWPTTKEFVRHLRSVVKAGACAAGTMPVITGRLTDMEK